MYNATSSCHKEFSNYIQLLLLSASVLLSKIWLSTSVFFVIRHFHLVTKVESIQSADMDFIMKAITLLCTSSVKNFQSIFVLFFFVHVIVIFPFIKFLLIWDSYSNGNFWNFLFESQGNNFGCCCHKVSGSWIFITTQNLKVIGGEAWFFLAYSRLCYSYFSYIWLLIYSW